MPGLLTVAKSLNQNYVSDSKPQVTVLDGDEQADLYYWGTEATPGIMKSWQIPLLPAAGLSATPLLPAQPLVEFSDLFPAGGQSPIFLHVTQTKFLQPDGTGLAERVIVPTGDTKEFGPGFYTMAPESYSSGDCKRVADKWFAKASQTWSVVGFRIPKQPNFWGAFLREAGGGDIEDLVFYLTTMRGHRRGGVSPDAADRNAIERINLRGKVLIFPSDDSAVRVPGRDGLMRASDVSNAQGRNLPGMPWVVIGPQRPDCMNNARQVAWVYGLGLWLINSSVRMHVYRDR